MFVQNDWVDGGIKGTSRNPWKDILSEFPLFFSSKRGAGWEDTYFWVDKWSGDRPLCSLFSCLFSCLLPETFWLHRFLLYWSLNLLPLSVFVVCWPIGKQLMSWLFYPWLVTFSLDPIGRCSSKGFSCSSFLRC